MDLDFLGAIFREIIRAGNARNILLHVTSFHMTRLDSTPLVFDFTGLMTISVPGGLGFREKMCVNNVLVVLY